MVELKLELNYLKETGSGQQSGFCLVTTNMANGQQADKLISWKAEVMLTILNNLEEDPKHLVQHFTGAQIMLIISITKLMLKNH